MKIWSIGLRNFPQNFPPSLLLFFNNPSRFITSLHRKSGPRRCFAPPRGPPLTLYRFARMQWRIGRGMPGARDAMEMCARCFWLPRRTIQAVTRLVVTAWTFLYSHCAIRRTEYLRVHCSAASQRCQTEVSKQVEKYCDSLWLKNPPASVETPIIQN